MNRCFNKNGSLFNVSATRHIAALGEAMLELRGPAFGTLQQGFGGDTLNTALYLARCTPGCTVHYATALGDDPLSDGLLARWRDEGLSTDWVQRLPGRLPGLYQIEVDAHGERRFQYWRGQSGARAFFDAPLTALEANAGQLDALLLSGISLAILPEAGRERALALMRKLRRRGALVAFDNNYRPRLWAGADEARHWMSLAFQTATLALVTADDHQALHALPDEDAAVTAAQALPTPEIAIKRGPRATRVGGAALGWRDVATEPVARVVDTTAAGDAFGAGYLSGRLQGLTPAAAAALGNRLAARVIQHPGALIPRDAMRDLLAPA